MTTTMTDYHHHYAGAIPARKPIGGTSMALRPAAPPKDLPLHPQQVSAPSHAHSRTVSSSIFPMPSNDSRTSPSNLHSSPQSYLPPNQQQQQQQQQQQPPPLPQQPQQPKSHPSLNAQFGPGTRRTPSTNTASTSSSGGNRFSTVSISLHRTPSTRSNASLNPTSYVALMRKQKATVWCDRSQPEDPRLQQAQKVAKARAAREVLGNYANPAVSKRGSGGSGGQGGVRAKIRHGKTAAPVGYSPATLLVGGSGVPARLSASEVGDEWSSDDEGGKPGSLRRQGGGQGSGRSGRSSMGSAKHGYTGSGSSWAAAAHSKASARLSSDSTPPGALAGGGGNLSNEVSPLEEDENEAAAAAAARKSDYFEPKRTNTTVSGGSSGSTRENSFGNVGEMSAPPSASKSNRDRSSSTEGKSADDLSRRGSVDERAMTMRGPRLFVANPDLSD